MEEPISIVSLASISPMGTTAAEIWKNYKQEHHLLVKEKQGDSSSWKAPLSLN